MIGLILISIAFIFEALYDAAKFYPKSKFWKHIPMAVNTTGSHVFKWDVLHISKIFMIVFIFLSGASYGIEFIMGYIRSTLEWTFWLWVIAIIASRLLFFDKLLYKIKYFT